MPAILMIKCPLDVVFGVFIVKIREWCHQTDIQPIRFVYQIAVDPPEICIEFHSDAEANKFLPGFPDASRLLSVQGHSTSG